MKTVILILILSLGVVVAGQTKAGTMNPCEYMNYNAEQANKLDTGDDDNFRRIVQQKNQELVRACLDYQTKLLEQQRNDLNRDNF